MRFEHSSAIKSPIVITRTMVWIFILGYALVLVGQSTYQNYIMNREIEAQKIKIAELERRKKILQLSLVYYRSSSYREIEARQRLNVKGKDEHVIALPRAGSEPMLSIATALQKESSDIEKTAPYKAWWQLFFGEKS